MPITANTKNALKQNEWWRNIVKVELSAEDSYFPEMIVEVNYQYSSKRSVMSDDDLLGNLRDPALGFRGDNLPYHLDLAHALFFDRLHEGATVLEIGCGGGQARSWFAAKKLHYVGTDISRTRVHEHLQENGGADLLCDAHFLPFKDAVFDVVYSAAVFEHLACPIRALQEISRVLKPGGNLLGNVSFLEAWHDSSYFHMSPLGVLEILTEAKLTPIAVWPSRGYSGFHALSRMSFAPWNPIRYFGTLLHQANLAERSFKAIVRRALKRTEKPDILAQCQIAGAMDWIAQKRA